MADNLGCIIKGHVGCYCSCSTDSRCCGCHQLRPKIKYHLHCLLCETDFSAEISPDGSFNQELYSQDNRLDIARAESCRKMKRHSLQR